MNSYVRPDITERAYFDNDGRLIDYGRRDPVADESGQRFGTNVFTNQDRFLPIFTVADALVDYIRGEYDVEISQPDTFPQPFRLGDSEVDEGVRRIVRIEPARPDQAPLTMRFGELPGAMTFTAGFFSGFDLWFCGCDACDDRWQDTAGFLEKVVLEVVEVGLNEVIDRSRWGRARYWLPGRRPRRWGRRPRRSGSIPKSAFDPAQLALWSEALRSLPHKR